MATKSDELADLFTTFQSLINKDEQLREQVREVTDKIDEISRKLHMLLQLIHQDNSANALPEIVGKSEKLIEECATHYVALGKIIAETDYYKHHDMWRFITQRIVFEVALTRFLKTGDLATREFVAQSLSIQTDQSKGFHLHLEDYLHGLLQMTSELSRYAVTSATSGDYARPIQIANFVNELNAGFRLLNFKNDSLRKRFDGLKYDLKKIEEVVYDLSIRGLKQTAK